MKELSSYDVSELLKELQFLVTGKVDGIYQTDPKELYLQVYIKDKPKQLLRIIAGKFLYLSSARPSFDEHMQRFCAFLRKYILNSRIVKIEQIGYERIVSITLQTKEKTYNLIIELFGKGNIILADKNKILAVTEEQIWADRTVKPGVEYVYPQKSDSKAAFEKYKEKGSAVTSAMIDKELSVTIQKKKTSVHDKEMKKIQVIIEKQNEQLTKAERESSENKRKGELIYEHFNELQEMLKKASAKGSSEEELKKQLQKNKLFKSINLKEHILTVEIP